MRELQVLRVRYTCGQVISKHGNKLISQLKALALLFKQHKCHQQNNNHVNINKDVKTMRVLTSASILVISPNSSSVVDQGTVVEQKGGRALEEKQ